MWLDAALSCPLLLDQRRIHHADALAHSLLVLVQRLERRRTDDLQLVRDVLQNHRVHFLLTQAAAQHMGTARDATDQREQHPVESSTNPDLCSCACCRLGS